MGSSGGGGTTTTQTKSDPWSGQQGYLSDIYSKAAEQYKTPMSYYPESTVAGFSPEQQLSQGLTFQRSTQGSPLVGAAQAENLKTVQGDYLNPDSNPYLGYYTQKAFEQSLPSWDTSAVKAGRYGGGAWALGKENLQSDITQKIYGGAYDTERARQQAAVSQAIPLANQDYYDIGQLTALGEEKQAMQQAQINDAKARYDYAQMEPWQRLQLYNNMVQGNVGSSTTGTTQMPGTSRTAGLLGGAATGAAAGIPLAPMTAGLSIPIGAAIGGGLGYFM